jgi:N-acylneuraminate cytidylyltransferase
MKVVAIIPARGGSKSIPGKNIKLLHGKPLIAYSIMEAKDSKYIERIIVSTDSKEIAEIAREYGAEVPFLRPVNIAADATPDLPVFQHALKWLSVKDRYIPDIVVHLRPTSPFRKAKHIDEGVELLMSNRNADSVRSVCIPGQNPYKMWKIEKGYLRPVLSLGGRKTTESYNMPRQKLPTVYWQNAAVDIIRWRTIVRMNSMTGKKILPLVMDEKYSLDVDTPMDFKIAEILSGLGE